MADEALPTRGIYEHSRISCMKAPQNHPAWLIGKLLIYAALLLAAGCATKVPVRHDGVLSAEVVRLKGAARYSTGGEGWHQLKVGSIVKPGTLIQTAAKSRVDLVLVAETRSCRPSTERNWVRIWDNALLGIDKLSVIETGTEVVTDTQLELKAGHINGVVERMSAGSKYEVKMPNGIAGIRGTAYDLTAEGDVKVWSGSVVLSYVGPNGTTQTQVIMGQQNFDAPLGVLPATAGVWKNSPVSRRF